jgi:predicted dehydrogenase
MGATEDDARRRFAAAQAPMSFTGRPTRIGQVGFGPWGRNVARNFADVGDLAWLCDRESGFRELAESSHPEARWTERFEDLIEDASVDAIAIATDVPTHYPLAKEALEAGKHVFVEKPPAMRGAEMDELVAIADERDLALMPGHLLLYHPGVAVLKGMIESGELGDVFYLYGQRVNFGVIRAHENALWSLGVHDLSVILYLLDEEPEEVTAHGRAFLQPGVEDVVFCELRFPSGKMAHMHLSWLDPHKLRKMTVVGSAKQVVFDDMEPLERKLIVYENVPQEPLDGEGLWGSPRGAVSTLAAPDGEPLRLECEHFLALVGGDGDRGQVAQDGARVVRALERLEGSLRGS